MVARTIHEKKTRNTYHYYKCPKRSRHGINDACANKKHHGAEKAEVAVRELISGLLKNLKRLHLGLEAMIEQERAVGCAAAQAELVEAKRRVRLNEGR